MLCLGQDFRGGGGDTGVPLPKLQGGICKFWGTHQICQIFTCSLNTVSRLNPVTISGSFHYFLHNFILDFDRFGSRMGVYVTAVVSAIAIVINWPASFQFAFSAIVVVLDWLRNQHAMHHYHW